MISGASLRLLEPFTPLVALAVVVLVVLALRLYRRTEPPLRPRVRGGLLALRALSIALLAFLLLDPILSFVRARRVPPRVPVLVDASLSMSIPFPDSASATPAPTRAERLFDTLEREDVLAELGDGARVEMYRFGERPARLAWADPREETRPTDDRTDLARALIDAAGEDARTTGAVVVFSDGAHNVGQDPRAAARRLGVPVIAVGVGSDAAVRDVSVFEVEASAVAYVDNRVPVAAKLRARGDAVSGLPVYLSEGETILDSTRVDLPGGGIERKVDLKYVPKREGLHRYRVWTPSSASEISAANNEHVIAVRVLKEKIKVLLAAGRPGFELEFLKRSLEADISLAVTPVILSLRDMPGRMGGAKAAFPENWANLAAYDLVVLLDVSRGDLPEARASMLARFVQDRRGALLVIGGGRAFELAETPLAEVLPVVTNAPVRMVRGTIHPILADVGRAHPVTRLDGDAEVNRRLWEDLPPLQEAPLLKTTSPRARVLVHGEGAPGPGGNVALVATLEGRAGRVLTMAGGPFWRWELYPWGQGRSGDTYRRFVSRAVRWLVSRDELKQVTIRPSQPLFEGSEPIVIEGQIFDHDFRPVQGADVRVTVRGPAGAPEERARELALVDQGDGRSTATIPALPPGDYVVEGRATREGVVLGEDRSEMSVTPYLLELDDPAPNFELLREIARASGGAFLRLDEAEKIREAVKLEPVEERTVRESAVRESPWAFAALLGLLGCEWSIRKRRGLP